MASQLEAHLKTHVPCAVEDCSFAASKRVVGAHFQTAHGAYSGQGLKEIEVEGQKFMVLVGNSTEDIEKWRAERRKKWPGAKGQPPNEQQSLPISKKRKLSSGSEPEEGECEEEEYDQVITTEPATSIPASATSNGPMTPFQPPLPPLPPPDEPHEPSPKKQRRLVLCKKFLHNQCRFGTNCRFSHDRKAFACRGLMYKGVCHKQNTGCPFSHDPAEIQAQQARREAYNAKQAVDVQLKQEQGSLLRKLLQKDVHVEQHKLLQITRFLVSNDFLQEPKPTVIAPEAPIVALEPTTESIAEAVAEPITASEPVEEVAVAAPELVTEVSVPDAVAVAE